ncbi:GGDEF domain-containing protein [Kosmotoga pacifica]|uniref:GGDEF domain-containing protein n=1 Tax=Kosmotoga pacifica TaxID=1330330 RepID=UPI002352F90A|nr:GGDEF domain-containing protein [Kosmotoga pacifica]
MIKASSLGKRFLLAEVLSLFSHEFSKDQLTRTIEKAKSNGNLIEKDGILSFKDADWKHFFEKANVSSEEHLALATFRQLKEGIYFHYENSQYSKRSFAAALLWQARKDYYNWLPREIVLEKVKAADSILGFESWASRNIKIHLQGMINTGKRIDKQLIEEWMEGKLHVDYLKFARILRILLDENDFRALLSRKLEQKLTDYQKKALEFNIMDSKAIRKILKEDLSEAERFSEKLLPKSPQYALLKVLALNLLARYFRVMKNKKYKQFLESALNIAKRFNQKDWIAKLFNNLSIYYEEDFRAYSEQLKLNAIKTAEEIGDYYTAAFTAINLAYNYLSAGQKSDLQKMVEKIGSYTTKTNNPEIKFFFLELKATIALYDKDISEFEINLDRYKEIAEKAKDPRILSRKHMSGMLKILYHLINGSLEAIKGVPEKLMSHPYLTEDEYKFLEIIKTGLDDPAEGYVLFKEYREKMHYYVEEIVQFISQILPKTHLNDFREFVFKQLISARRKGLLLSQAQLYHALGIATFRLEIQHDALRYIRFAAFLYDASGMTNLSRDLRNTFLQRESFVDLIREVEEKLEKSGTESFLLQNLKESARKANDSLRYIGKLMAVVLSFTDAENFEQLAEIIFKNLLEEFPANSGTFELLGKTGEVYHFGDGRIPVFDSVFNLDPFYVSYSFNVGFDGKARLELYNPDQRVNYADVQRFYDLMTHLEPIIELALINFMRYRMAIRDELTGLYTRWYFEERFKEEFARTQRTLEKFSLIFCDLDDFKKINDKYGHKAGDEVLKNVASIFLQNARTTDVVCRFGGEEFVFLLPFTSREGAMALAERLRKALESSPFDISVTGSFGVATYPSEGIESREELFRKADDLCYRAKSDGKNLVRG